MASINVGEADFVAVAGAARDAKAAGNMDAARVLDKVARKINAALSSSNATLVTLRRMSGLPPRAEMSWRDMPSTIDEDRP